METLPFIGWLILMGFILSPLFAAFSEASKFDKKIKELEKSRKSIRNISITVESVQETPTEPSPYQGSKQTSSQLTTPTETEVSSSFQDNQYN